LDFSFQLTRKLGDDSNVRNPCHARCRWETLKDPLQFGSRITPIKTTAGRQEQQNTYIQLRYTFREAYSFALHLVLYKSKIDVDTH